VKTTAPTIPRRAVIIKPPGSLPGIRAFATKPAIRPIIIAQIMLILYLF
jgi:hypothetical protein